MEAALASKLLPQAEVSEQVNSHPAVTLTLLANIKQRFIFFFPSQDKPQGRDQGCCEKTRTLDVMK